MLLLLTWNYKNKNMIFPNIQRIVIELRNHIPWMTQKIQIIFILYKIMYYTLLWFQSLKNCLRIPTDPYLSFTKGFKYNLEILWANKGILCHYSYPSIQWQNISVWRLTTVTITRLMSERKKGRKSESQDGFKPFNTRRMNACSLTAMV